MVNNQSSTDHDSLDSELQKKLEENISSLGVAVRVLTISQDERDREEAYQVIVDNLLEIAKEAGVGKDVTQTVFEKNYIRANRLWYKKFRILDRS